MLNGRQTRAIARLEGGKRAGTGFLVSVDGQLLTAHHVLPEPGVQLSVRFRVGDEKPIAAIVLKGNTQQDWALIQLVDANGVARPAPEGVTPLPLIELSSNEAIGRSWGTFGYADEDPAGIPRKGTFAIFDDVSFELEGNVQGLRMSGLSGAPILVDGEVVAIVLESDEQQEGVSAAGRLLAVPLGLVFADQGVPRLVPQKPPLFTDHVAGYLPSEARRYRAVRDSLANVPDPLGPERVAAALLQGELLFAFRLCKRLLLDGNKSKLVLDYVASQFVPDDAARLLGEFCATRARLAQRVAAAGDGEAGESGPVAASLSAPSAGVRWHVLRGTQGEFPEAAAFTLEELGERMLPVVLDEELSADAAVEAIIDAARSRFPSRAERRLAPRGEWGPLGWFIVELDAWAAPEIHRAIARRFPGAHVVVRTGGVVEVPAELAADVVAIAPEIAPHVFRSYEDTFQEA